MDGQLRWVGRVCPMTDKRITRRIHQTKEQGSKKKEVKENMVSRYKIRSNERGTKWEGIKEMTRDSKRWKKNVNYQKNYNYLL